MRQSLIISALAPVTQLLTQFEVRWYVCGSVASSMHGVMRTTVDADIVAELRSMHAKPFADALRSEYYVSEPMIADAINRQRSFNVIHLATSFKVDVFAVKNRAFDQSTIMRIKRNTFVEYGEELPLVVASAEDVILNKLEWYRKGNEISERQWEDILGVFRVQRDDLDFEYLKRWARDLEISDLLDRACREVPF